MVLCLNFIYLIYLHMNIRKIAVPTLILVVLVFAGIYFYSVRVRFLQAVSTSKVQYNDLAGRKVSITRNVHRIILLRSKDIYELAALLGDELPKKLVAWGPDLQTDDKEAYDKFIEKYPSLKEIPVTGSIYSDGLSAEQLVNLHPDLVIADRFILDRGYKYVSKLTEAGLPVVYLDGSTDPLTGSQRGITLLGQILGKEARAKEIVNYADSQLDIVRDRLIQLHPTAPKVYLEAGSGGPSTFSQTYGSAGNPKEYTSWGAVLHQLRVDNIADGVVSKQEKINPEYIIQKDPEIIIITGQHWTAGNGSMQLGYFITQGKADTLLRSFASRPGWSTLSAIQHHRLYSVFHNTAIILCFAAVQALAKDCYPAIFKDLDPEASLRLFYTRFLPISYSGTWMAGGV